MSDYLHEISYYEIIHSMIILTKFKDNFINSFPISRSSCLDITCATLVSHYHMGLSRDFHVTFMCNFGFYDIFED